MLDLYLFVCLYLIGESVKLVPFRGIFCPTALVWRLLRRLSDKKQEYFPSVTNFSFTMFRIGAHTECDQAQQPSQLSGSPCQARTGSYNIYEMKIILQIVEFSSQC